MIPTVKKETLIGLASQLKTQDALSNSERYAEMYEQQPVFKMLIRAAIEEKEWSYDKKDGFCRGVLQAWMLINQQDFIDSLEE
jgi:hypothetical protein